MVNKLKYSNDSSLSGSLASLNENESLNEQNDRTVYLGDLDLDTSEIKIADFFNSIKLKTIKIIKQPHSSFAHVIFENSAIAKFLLEKAIISMHGKTIRVMPFNQPNNFDPNANLIIKNLESYLNELDIIQKFKPYGDILSCKLVRDSKGESKCYAYLQFKEKSSAILAIDNLNNTYWDEKYDPDVQYQRYKEKLNRFKQTNVLNEIDLNENMVMSDYTNNKIQHGKKIYVGLFKKKDEYSKIKQEKEGKPSNLYVKNFGPNFGDRDLFNLFKSFGSIKSAKVRRQKLGMIEKPLGCGFVDFENPEEAEEARLALNGYVLSDSGRIISVTYADCKSRRMRKKLEENNNVTTMNVNNYLDKLDQNEYKFEQLISNAPSPSNSIKTDENDFFFNNKINNNNNDSGLIEDLESKRCRSMSNSSESSFDLILFEWCQLWNRKLYTEYRLFY